MFRINHVSQIRTLQRPRHTRWSSHFKSLCSLMRLFGPSYVVFTDIPTKGSTSSQKGDAVFAVKHAMSFDFVIAFHMMKDIMGITDKLCQSLQQKSIDIMNALALVSTTKILLQKLRDEVVCFCKRSDTLVPDMNETYKYVIRTRSDNEIITTEHHY
uniref:Uncharacterized protein n=1 Tax=Lactuca sativa TaxID=4236 RepID=A0A9R1WTE9_LACSA|nr:hypothetical protein LSAT_V11C100038460 [Lactuca sativa]